MDFTVDGTKTKCKNTITPHMLALDSFAVNAKSHIPANCGSTYTAKPKNTKLMKNRKISTFLATTVE